jgi:bacterioferritin
MKGNAQVIERLNLLLADELTAINQYMVHAEMCDNWGYSRLESAVEKRSITEMKHAEKLIARILFLEGLPVVSVLNPLHIGADVPAQLRHDADAEIGAIKSYNEVIGLCGEAADHGTQEMLKGILQDEEAHLDWLETQQDQIGQMGLQTYLLGQIA